MSRDVFRAFLDDLRITQAYEKVWTSGFSLKFQKASFLDKPRSTSFIKTIINFDLWNALLKILHSCQGYKNWFMITVIWLQGTYRLHKLWYICINVIYLCSVVSSKLLNQLCVSSVCYQRFFESPLFCSLLH